MSARTQPRLRNPCKPAEDRAVARMIPESPVETESNAERKLFERLRDETPDEIVAFHSVAWQLPGKNGRPEQGEADFVLAHPDYGVLTLEVKGGTIRYDAQAGKWFTTGKKGESRIKDPGRQARSSSHALGRALARSARGGDEAISFGHAVAFPDCRVPRKALRPDLPRELVLDHADIARLPEKVDGLFRHWFDPDKKAPLGASGIERLERLLANSFELRAPLAFELAEEERRLYRLTEQQYQVLDMLSRQTRVAIAGCAGSGKTFLAAEKARRLAAQGFRVLVVVFNVLLAEHLRRGLADEPNITVRAFYGLCREVAEEAGLEFADEPEPGEEGEYYTGARGRVRRARGAHVRPLRRADRRRGPGRRRRLVASAADPPRRPRPQPALRLLRRQPEALPRPDRPAVPRGAVPADRQLPQHAADQRARHALLQGRHDGRARPGGPARRPARVRDGGRAPRAARRGGRAVDRRGGGRTRRHRAPHRAQRRTGARSGRWTRSAASA